MTQKSWLDKVRLNTFKAVFRLHLYEFDALEEHRLFAEDSLHGANTSLEERVNKAIAAMEPEDQDAYHDHMYDEYVRMNETVPRIQWSSQFLLVYSTFEHILNELCRLIQRRSGLERSFKDIGGHGINRAKNYLTKVAGIKSPFQDSTSWKRARLLAEIRNKIAHENGEIELTPNCKKSLGARLASEQHLELKKLIPDQGDAQIILSNEFVRQSISELREVLVNICDCEPCKDES